MLGVPPQLMTVLGRTEWGRVHTPVVLRHGLPKWHANICPSNCKTGRPLQELCSLWNDSDGTALSDTYFTLDLIESMMASVTHGFWGRGYP